MALDYHINSDEGLINLLGEHQISIADVHDCGERLFADMAFDAQLPQLIDLREAHIDMACAQPNLASLVLQRYNQVVQANVAVVIPSGLPPLEIAELYRLTCAIDQAELFDDYDQALRWLIRTEFAMTVPVVTAPPGALRPSGQQPDAACQ